MTTEPEGISPPRIESLLTAREAAAVLTLMPCVAVSVTTSPETRPMPLIEPKASFAKSVATGLLAATVTSPTPVAVTAPFKVMSSAEYRKILPVPELMPPAPTVMLPPPAT